MKSRIVKAIISVLFATFAICAVGFMSACSCNNRKSEVTVTFVTNGGKEIAPITLKKGEEITLPTAEKEGRVFADWYYDEGFASVCPKKITAQKDETLYARYGAQLWYEFELVDDPDYQTRDYDKYVTIGNGSPIISRNFPFKSLKYVIKVKLLPRHGVYASGIERIFYVEYRNPDGRDYAVMNN